MTSQAKNNAFAFYAKRLEQGKVPPRLKIELEDTNGKVAKGKLAKTKEEGQIITSMTYTITIFKFEDFDIQDGFNWSKVKHFKIHVLTSQRGQIPSPLLIDYLVAVRMGSFDPC